MEKNNEYLNEYPKDRSCYNRCVEEYYNCIHEGEHKAVCELKRTHCGSSCETS